MTTQESFICVLCKESFGEKDTLQIHFRKHGDPSFNKQIKKPAQSELEVSKESDGKSELVHCDVCPEVFPTISKAITHKHKFHPNHDTKYFCHWCGKLFTMKHLYNKHLTSHVDLIMGDDVFHCDCCDIDFSLPSAMIYHNKFFHRQDTDLPVLGHSRKQMFVNKELMQLYYCAFCGEEYINKVNLHKHMKDEHGDENQSPENVLRCPLCEAVFYHLDAYELHLTFHTREDIYNGKEDDIGKDDITEFTLESVPPISEQVENLEQEESSEKNTEVNIEDFLQLAMAENEESNASGKKKHKKHKKHKKSKKDAITLDEFLNMNSDVFGEGLDFQGVEELPTKVVQRLNKSKPQKVVKTVTKVSATPELEKLKQLGIAIKMKSATIPRLMPGMKIKNAANPVTTRKLVKIVNEVSEKSIIKPPQSNQTPAKPSNEEVLSKLLNQTHNQIVISKKSQSTTLPNLEPASSPAMEAVDSIGPTPSEKLEVECDEEAKNSSDVSADNKMNPSNSTLVTSNLTSTNNIEKSNPNKSIAENVKNNADCKSEDDITDYDDVHEDNKGSDFSDDNVSDIEAAIENPGANILKRIHHITIKSLSQSKPASPNSNSPNRIEINTKKQEVSKSVENPEKNGQTDVTAQEDKNDIAKKQVPLDVLKKLGHLTVKTSQRLPQTEKNEKEIENDPTISAKKIQDNVSAKIDQGRKTDITPQEDKNDIAEKQVPLDVLKNLGHLTVKSSQRLPQTEINEKNIENDQTISAKKIHDKDSANIDQDRTLEALKKVNPNIIIKSNKQISECKNNVIDRDHDADDEYDHESDHLSDHEADGLDIVASNDIQTKPNISTTSALKNIGQCITIKQTSVPKPPIEEVFNKDKVQVLEKKTQISSIKKLSSQLTVKPVRKPIVNRDLSNKEISKDEEIFSVDDSDSDDMESKAKTQTLPPPLSAPTSRPPQNKMLSMPANIIKNSSQNMPIKKETVTETNDDDEAMDSDYDNDMNDAEEEIKPNIITKPQISDVAQKLMNNKNISFKNTNLKLQTIHNDINKPQMPITSTNNSQSLPNNPVLDRQMVLYDPSVLTKSNSDERKTNVISNRSLTAPKKKSLPQSSPSNSSNRQMVKYNPNAHFSDSNSDADDIPDDLSNHSSEADSSLAHSRNDEPKKELENDVNRSLKDFSVDSDEHQFSDDVNDEGTCGSNSQMLINKLKNINQNLSIKSSGSNNKVASSSNYQNISKNETIKSVNDNRRQITQSKVNCLKRESTDFLTENDDDEFDDECPSTSKKQKVVEQVRKTNKIVQRAPARQAAQQVCATGTVNQQVTTSVKTIQSETVVEEITTTVTRTIKTINREVSMSGNQTISRVNIVTPIMVRGPRPRANAALQGAAVRGAARARVRQTAPPRPGNATARAPNQITPIRPPLNQIRSSNPRMPMRVRPATAPSQPRTTRPIKISQNVQQALTRVNKAPGPESPGHFSCFKKPKESLIPMDSSDDEAMPAHTPFESAKINASKTMQSESVMEMRSEIRSSSNQQISKFNTVSGLQILKRSSETKQVVNKVENCVLGGNRTMAAIERLQKQGLLVKRPRLEAADSCSEDEGGGDDALIDA